LLAGPLEIAVAGPPGSQRDVLSTFVRAGTSPGAVSVVGEANAPGVPLLAGRCVAGLPVAVFVCEGFVCQAPTADVFEVTAAVRTRMAGKIPGRGAIGLPMD
jgi:uncharacterized protein YyaL (SSP411 family)